MERLRLSAFELAWLIATLFCVVWLSALGILLGALGGSYAFYEDKRVLCGVYVVLTLVAAGIELSRL